MTSTSGPEFPRLENYEILEVIGQGGMGTVYLAQDLRHDRRVAIKTLRHGIVTPDLARRFEREIKLTSGLQHPRILPLLDSGVSGGTLYYVMQFVEGESLDERLAREGPLPVQDALRIARHVADALDSSHARGIVHRDIKPANVMLSGGHALVMDFGVARALEEGSTELTGTGVALGTPKYMSPEQVADSTAVDARADIYSLGCVLYEMLAGTAPFTGPTVDSIVRQHLAADPPRLAVHRPGVPPEIEEIVLRTMQKSPPDRFQSARELADALQEVSAGAAGAAVPAGRRRNAFLVIAAYLAGGWGVLALVERVAETANLPAWTVPFALVLLLIGLLVVGATAVLQASGGWGPAPGGTTDPGGRGRGRGAGGQSRLDALFRWRNVVAGGVLALLLWGVVAVASLMRGSPGEEAAPAGSELALGEDALTGPDRPSRDAGPGAAPDTGAGGVAERGAEGGVDDPSTVAEPETTPRDRQLAVLARARRAAESARSDAESAGARHASTPALRRADSLWTLAVDAGSAGRLPVAAASFEAARLAYGDAAREAPRILSARVDSAVRGVDSLRERADPERPEYAEGDRLRERGSEAEARGDLVAALDALRDAGRAFGRAPALAATPPPDTAPPETAGEGGAEDTEAPAPAPGERVAGAMSALERAFEAEDLSGIRRIWVNLGERQLEGFREFFEGGSEFEYGYRVDEGSIRTVGEGIEFEVVVDWEYTGERGDRISVDPFRQRFRLEAAGDQEVLRSL